VQLSRNALLLAHAHAVCMPYRFVRSTSGGGQRRGIGAP
tara:strand:+ start:1179 stop:1295 length:117 start_codon:yes stop_codon:yes gene_type:complete